MATIEHVETFNHPNSMSINGHSSRTIKTVETDELPDGRYNIWNVMLMFPDLHMETLEEAIRSGALRISAGQIYYSDYRPFDGLMEGCYL